MCIESGWVGGWEGEHTQLYINIRPQKIIYNHNIVFLAVCIESGWVGGWEGACVRACLPACLHACVRVCVCGGGGEREREK